MIGIFRWSPQPANDQSCLDCLAERLTDHQDRKERDHGLEQIFDRQAVTLIEMFEADPAACDQTGTGIEDQNPDRHDERLETQTVQSRLSFFR